MSRTLVVAVAVGMATLLTSSAHAQHAVSVSATIVEPLAAEDLNWEVYGSGSVLELRAKRLLPAAGTRVVEQAWIAGTWASRPSVAGEQPGTQGTEPAAAAPQPLHDRSQSTLVLPPLVRRQGTHRIVVTRVVAAHS